MCFTPPFDARAFARSPVGVDESEGRYAEVFIDTCNTCGQTFLPYAFAIEGLSGSGRWYRAPLPILGPRPSAATAVSTIARAPFHYVGGSYFSSAGTLRAHPLDVRSL